MADRGKDHWDSGDYQHSASFVPKLAGKVTQWLDLQKDDVILDIGCGDGILNLEFAKALAQGKGTIHGIDSSAAMIDAAKELCKDHPNATFEVVDGTEIEKHAALQEGTFTKAFSNAAMHWILRRESTRQSFFRAVHASLRPGGTFAFEMGGLGNVKEMAAALLAACARRHPGGLPAVVEGHYPWFFPDEAWATEALERAGFRVDKVGEGVAADQGGPGRRGRLVQAVWEHDPREPGQGGGQGGRGEGGGRGAEGGVRRRQGRGDDFAAELACVAVNRWRPTPPGGFPIVHIIKVAKKRWQTQHHITTALCEKKRRCDMVDQDQQVRSYRHLAQMPRADDALRMLKRIASAVQPIMRNHNWRVGELAEFYPNDANLLGKIQE
ncbi:hypothetical protein NLG97_g10482 [Lecanicillium saksenae]|uniref:Uncharacterized protein n=1 Tax=Lecanicillium saksenae TaxID=468837 RepID=A0ACC1QFJ0_9HYPO|nr:hypothetical protein NLG97_g10482 [Lecanicillium saksenae]